MGVRDKDGYGRLRRGKIVLGAHREAYRLLVGPIPEGLDVLHHCDNRPCCNPAHLYAGTSVDNMRDRDTRGRHVPTQGELHGMVKLSEANVHEIIAERATGTRGVDLARRFNVSQATVSFIIHRKRWRHVG
jgi:hypothetical protein